MAKYYTCFHLSCQGIFQIVAELQNFTAVTKLIKNFKNLYGFGDVRDACMDFEPCFKVSVHPKSPKLRQMTNLT